MKIVRLDEVDSTNLYARSLIGEGEELAVISLRQTGGRGTNFLTIGGLLMMAAAAGGYVLRRRRGKEGR